MVFTTRNCARHLSFLATLLVVAGCRGEPADFGFETRQVTVRPLNERLQVSLRQDIRLSWETRNALQHGVPLVITVSLELLQPGNAVRLVAEQRRYEIRYLPMSQRYELSEAEGAVARTYPRLRHVVNALARLDTTLDSGPLAPGEYQLRARMRLEQSSLPMPMQLPVLISGRWRHDTDWSTWPFTISA